MYSKWLQKQFKVSHEKTSKEESQMVCDRIEEEKKKKTTSQLNNIVNDRDE